MVLAAFSHQDVVGVTPLVHGRGSMLGAWPLLLLGAGVAPWLPRPGAVLSRVALALSVCPPHAEGRALVLQQGLHMWGHVASAKEHFSL